MKIVWLAEAQNDLNEIAEYFMQDDPNTALRVIETIREATNVLARHPNFGRVGRVKGTRELIIVKFPFIVAYEVEVSEIRILAVMHTSRKWPDFF